MASIENIKSQEKAGNSAEHSDSNINSLSILNGTQSAERLTPTSSLPDVELLGEHKGFFSSVVDKAKDVYQEGADIATNVASALSDLSKTAKDSAPLLVPLIKDAGQNLFHKAEEKISGSTQSLAAEIGRDLSQKAQSVENFASNTVQKLGNSLSAAEKSLGGYVAGAFEKGTELEQRGEKLINRAVDIAKEFGQDAPLLLKGMKDPAVGPELRKLYMHQSLMYEEGLAKGFALNALNGYLQFEHHLYGPAFKSLTGKETHIPRIKFPNDAEIDKSMAGKMGTIVGQITQSVLLACATGGGSFLANVGKGALFSGILTPTSDKDFWKQRAENLAFGVTGGLFSELGGKTLGGITQSAPEMLNTVAEEFGKKSFGAIGNAVNDEIRHLINEGKSLPPVQLAKDIATGFIPGLGAKNRA